MLTIRCESCVFCRALESEHTGLCKPDLPEPSTVYREELCKQVMEMCD